MARAFEAAKYIYDNNKIVGELDTAAPTNGKFTRDSSKPNVKEVYEEGKWREYSTLKPEDPGYDYYKTYKASVYGFPYKPIDATYDGAGKQLVGRDVAFDDVVDVFRKKLAEDGELNDDFLREIYSDTVDAQDPATGKLGLRDDSNPALNLIWNAYSNSPPGFKANI